MPRDCMLQVQTSSLSWNTLGIGECGWSSCSQANLLMSNKLPFPIRVKRQCSDPLPTPPHVSAGSLTMSKPAVTEELPAPVPIPPRQSARPSIEQAPPLLTQYSTNPISSIPGNFNISACSSVIINFNCSRN